MYFSAETKNTPTGSLWKLIKIPAVLVVSIIIVVSSNVWSFLDPVLEPHLESVSTKLNVCKHLNFLKDLISSVFQQVLFLGRYTFSLQNSLTFSGFSDCFPAFTLH